MGRPGNQYSVVESRIALLRGIREAVARLEAGQYLVVFPEGYPLIDPHLPGRRGPQAALYPGAVWLARRAARTRGCVPVVPIRLHYEADCIRLSIEAPLSVRDGASLEALDRALAARLGSVPVETTATVFSTRKE
jgi:putative membrane protein